MKPRRRLRVPLPAPHEIDLADMLGRTVRGRAMQIRVLYAQERCSVEELAAYFGVQRHQVSRMLRTRLQSRKPGRNVTRTKAVRAAVASRSLRRKREPSVQDDPMVAVLNATLLRWPGPGVRVDLKPSI